MNKKVGFLALGLICCGVSIIMWMNGIVYQFGVFGTGSGIVFILWALIGDKSDPETQPRKIARNFKVKGVGDVSFIEGVLSGFSSIPQDWSSKKNPANLRDKILNLKNMSTIRIKYTFGNSLITYFQVSFTKSKKTYMITIEGEGEQSVELFERNFAEYIEE